MTTNGLRMHVMTLVLSAALIGCSTTNPRVTTRFNAEASLRGELPWNPLQGTVVATWVDSRNSTTSTLYGNDAAFRYARSAVGGSYPMGAVLAVVTWKQQEDERWFGAKIPAAIESVEFVNVGGSAGGAVKYIYTQYIGTPLLQTQAGSEETRSSRAAWILAQRAAEMP